MTIDVCSLETKQLLTVEEALEGIKNAVATVKETEIVSLKNALGRVLAVPVMATLHLPGDRNSAMDGYAFASGEIKQESFSLTLVGTSWAGRPFTGELKSGECVRIFTGAVLPEQADSVIMQEQVTVENQSIRFPANCRGFQNIREIGEDVKQGSLLLDTQKKLHAADLGLLAAAGVNEVKVVRKLKIAFFSTGDELIPLGQALKSGQIYDSNRYILHGLLADCCYEISDMGVIVDDKGILEKTLVTTAENFDMIITTGGASVGEADYIQEILAKSGRVNFWKIAMKPGKPLAFGNIGQCLFFGLPGNPIAVMATFDKFVKPALRQLSGEIALQPLQLKAVCQTRLKKKPGRQEYQRGILTQNQDGMFIVESAGRQGSNILSTMSRANCYIVLPIECSGVQVGEEVMVEPFKLDI
jgi:molybdopterin molybdotransferase